MVRLTRTNPRLDAAAADGCDAAGADGCDAASLAAGAPPAKRQESRKGADSGSGDVLAAAGVDADPVALVDEQGHLDDDS